MAYRCLILNVLTIGNGVSFRFQTPDKALERRDGVEERQPRTDEEWIMDRYHALELIEATNLLAMEGRQVTAPEGLLQEEGLDGNLTADQIQTVLETNRPAFIAYTHLLHDLVMESLAAIDAKDPAGLSDSRSTIDEACEACHTTFLYPAAQ